jgi:hypothetical protein
MPNTLESCAYISELKRYAETTQLSYGHLHLKSKIDKSNAIVNTEFIPLKYLDILKKDARTVTLSDEDYINYKYQPKKYCYDKYGTVELWVILLRLNNMTSIMDFNKKTFKVPPSNTYRILNEILILERDNILKNEETIGY